MQKRVQCPKRKGLAALSGLAHELFRVEVEYHRANPAHPSGPPAERPPSHSGAVAGARKPAHWYSRGTGRAPILRPPGLNFLSRDVVFELFPAAAAGKIPLVVSGGATILKSVNANTGCDGSRMFHMASEEIVFDESSEMKDAVTLRMGPSNGTLIFDEHVSCVGFAGMHARTYPVIRKSAQSRIPWIVAFRPSLSENGSRVERQASGRRVSKLAEKRIALHISALVPTSAVPHRVGGWLAQVRKRSGLRGRVGICPIVYESSEQAPLATGGSSSVLCDFGED